MPIPIGAIVTAQGPDPRKGQVIEAPPGFPAAGEGEVWVHWNSIPDVDQFDYLAHVESVNDLTVQTSLGEPLIAQTNAIRRVILDRLAQGTVGNEEMFDALVADGYDERAVRSATWDLLSEGVLGIDFTTGHFGLINTPQE